MVPSGATRKDSGTLATPYATPMAPAGSSKGGPVAASLGEELTGHVEIVVVEDADDGCVAYRRVLLVEGGELWVLDDAGRAPGGEEVHDPPPAT